MQRLSFLIKLILLLIVRTAFAESLDLTQEEGNHTWAKSEAWTWMGHLNEYSIEHDKIVPDSKGVAIIHYYTRNQTQFGNLNFKSSALTFTNNGIGEVYDKNTLYMDKSQGNHNAQLKIKENTLDIEFSYDNKVDKVQKSEITNNDYDFLKNKLLPVYPGLEIADQYTPVKYTFSIYAGKNSHMKLDVYQIWPSAAPVDAKMKFLNIDDSYTFSQPMLVAHGIIENNGIEKPLIGLLFLDRQWSKDYFGKFIMGNPLDSLKQNQALQFSHNWSAFHAYSEESKNWYFVHLWQQYKRNKNKMDQVYDYSGIVSVRNGVQQNPIARDSFQWIGSNFVKNKSKVMLNYAVGREGYFPSSYHYENKFNNDFLNIQATPRLQSLDQPIYLFEGYASGEGVWNNENVKVQGRLESSRLLFRVQDYEEMLVELKKSTINSRSISSTIDINTAYEEEQKLLETHLDKIVAHENKCKNNVLCFISFLKKKKAQIDFMLNDLKQKLAIFQSGLKKSPYKRDPNDSTVVIYK